MPQEEHQALDHGLGVPLKTVDRNPFRNPEFLKGLAPASLSRSANPFLISTPTNIGRPQANIPDPSAGRQHDENDNAPAPAHHQVHGRAVNLATSGNSFIGINHGHVTQTEEFNVLRDLPIHPDVSTRLNDYFPGSRADDEAHILQWIDCDYPPELVLCVLGKVGVGKSTLAKHLAARLRQGKRLAASIFFSFALPYWSPESIIRMAAGQLCGAYPALTRAVSEAIRLDVDPSVSLETRIEHLILEPIRSLQLRRPLVVVLDALDQWAPHPILVKALSCLTADTHLVRLIILGRPGMEDRFQNVSFRIYNLPDVSRFVMGSYFRGRFNQVRWEYGYKPSDQTIDQLVDKAEGLFIWSSTLCSLLEDGQSCPSPHETLLAILRSQQTMGHDENLANLYHNIISLRFPKPGHKAKLRVFLGAVLVLQEPLPVAAFASLVSMEVRAVQNIQAGLASLQTRKPQGIQGLVYPASSAFHLSFLEYLQSSETPSHLVFPIDTFASHFQLGKTCLEELCRITSSPLIFTSPLQKYAIRYWPAHIAHGTPTVTPTSDVEWKNTPHFTIMDSLSIPQWHRWATAYLQQVHPGTSLRELRSPDEASGMPSNSTRYSTAISHVAESLAQGPVTKSTPDAIVVAEVVLRLRHQNVAAWLELALAYKRVALVTASSSLLDSAVHACRCAAEMGGDEARRIPAILGGCLFKRFSHCGFREDLEEALFLENVALSLAPPGHPDRPSCLNNLALSLRAQFELTGAAESLDRSITLLREALSLWPPNHLDRPSSLTNLAGSLAVHSGWTGTVDNLIEAILLLREALWLWQPGHHERISALNNVANCLHSHFRLTGAANSLDEAIALHREALSLRPPGHPDRAMSLCGLSASLGSQFELGNVGSLDEAIVLGREALSLQPSGYPERARCLSRLAICLQSHFVLAGNMNSLDEAIALHREALSLRPPGYAERVWSLNNLATSLHAHFGQTGDVCSLDEAIVFNREGLLLLPSGHPARGMCLNDLASAMQSHFEATSTADSLSEATSLHREALSLTPPGHRHHA